MLTLLACASAQTVLFDNGPLITHPGGGAGGADASALQSVLSLNTYGLGGQVPPGNRLADDFEVTAESGWQLDLFEVFVYQTGSGTSSSITAVNFRIWDGPPSAGGSSVIYGNPTDDQMLSSAFSGIYRVRDTEMGDTTRAVMTTGVDAASVYLPAGTYWLDFQAAGDFPTGPWFPPVTILGETVTGNALQYLASEGQWLNAGDTATSAQQGVPFVLHGWEASLDLVQEDIPVPDVAPGDTDVPVLAFYGTTRVAPGLTLNSLTVETLQADGVTPVDGSFVANIKLYLDANFDGVADTPGAPHAMLPAQPDGSAEFDLGIEFDAGVPVGFVIAYDLKDSLTTAAVPVFTASLALLLPALWLARRGRRAAALLAVGMIVVLVGACGSPSIPTEVEFRASITAGASRVTNGDFGGNPVSVDTTDVIGGTLSVTY